MISFERTCLIYPNGARALQNVTLEIVKGEIVFLVGSTGCGKTSLLKLINMEAFPSRGRVMLLGKDTLDYEAHKIPYIRRKIGVVFQDFKLLPGKTVKENVAFVLEVTGASRYEIERKIPQALDLVGLRSKANVFPPDLSGGEVQRVSIARAIVNEPMVLLADEPTGNLDPDTSWEIMQLLLRIQARGTTVLVASHDIVMVERVKKRVVAVNQGAVVSDQKTGGPPR